MQLGIEILYFKVNKQLAEPEVLKTEAELVKRETLS